MPETLDFEIPYPSYVDSADGPAAFQALADRVDELFGRNRDRWPINAADHGWSPDATPIENTAALTAALDQAELLGHDLFIPGGRCEIDFGSTTFTPPGLGSIVRAFNLRSHVKIFGEKGTVIYAPDPTVDITTFGGPQHTVFGNDGSAHHWAIEDIEFDGGFDSYPAGMVEQVHGPIHVGPCKDFSIQRNEMYGWRGGTIHGILNWDGADVVDWIERFTVSNNHIHDCLGVSIDFDRGAREFWCQNNVIENELGIPEGNAFGSESIWFGLRDYEKLKGLDGVITGNRIRRYGPMALENVERCHIDDNSVIWPVSNPCFRMGEMSHTTFTNNHGDADSPEPSADGRGLSIPFALRFHDNTIANNTFKRRNAVGAASGIRIGGSITGERVVVANNTVEGNGASGSEAAIHVDHVTKLTLTGNTCDEHIDIDPTVTDSTIQGNTASYLIAGCTDSTVGPNTLVTDDGPALWASGNGNAHYLGRLRGEPAFGVGTLRVDGSDNSFSGGIIEDARTIVNQAMVSEHGTAGNNLYRGVKLLGPQSGASNATVLAGSSSWA